MNNNKNQTLFPFFPDKCCWNPQHLICGLNINRWSKAKYLLLINSYILMNEWMNEHRLNYIIYKCLFVILLILAIASDL